LEAGQARGHRGLLHLRTATLTLCYAWFGVAAGWCSQDEAAQIESGVKSVLEQQDHPLYSQFLAEMHR
jgi:hypothetical protein